MSQKNDKMSFHQTVEQAWSLIRDARIQEARTISEQLVQDLQLLPDDERNEKHSLQGLMYAYHVAGYTVAMSTRNYDALTAIAYFSEMKCIASTFGDNAHLVIALTYQGDMYRRHGDLIQAMHCLQRAYHTKQPDQAARGNCAQLLGRLYSQQNSLEPFARVMQEAEQIAIHDEDPLHNSLHGLYCLGTVYADYARHYCKMGYFHKALDYLARAEASLPKTPHWSTFLTATRGLLLVRGGDLEQGMPYVIEAVELAGNHGNYRLLDHFYTLQQYLGRKAVEFNKASILLGDTLYGSPST